MPDTIFALQILLSSTALCASYALCMTLLKKTPSVFLARGIAVLTLAATGVSFGLSFNALFGSQSMLHTVSILSLILALANVFAIVLVHRFVMSTAMDYSPHLLAISKILAFITTAALVVHIAFEIAAIAGF